MFKYKSPLSRLLEGAGKAQEDEVVESTTPAEDKQEPIADFNALRAALAGGNMASEAYEEADELIPEGKMPDFEEPKVEVAEGEKPADEAVAPDTSVEDVETAAEVPAVESAEESHDNDQILTLHLTEDDAIVGDETVSLNTEETATDTAEVVVDISAQSPEAELEPAEQPATERAAPEPAPTEDRRSRVKTTFLGFERADTHVQDLIETATPVAKTETAQESFPVGWLVVTGGPGRGASIGLTEGLMQIGRNDDQAIQLDFGDTGISRSSHAVVAYDPEDRKCYLGHGGKANLVRLNGKPVLSTVPLASGDLIRISETSVRFVAFCDDGFDWRES
ncbi:FHA domain-containing protein [uncultured Ruegeria sp.]|uniref:FHA domain-containing protein n=1 Tax=uncultured Ruegeria sp. TaxID=259304 RepID=UPI002611A5EC|nr:FHA domain-containing protein [uncultured Ruegeria sp.]